MKSEAVTRKLAAVLMADVVGYSRMIGLDEVGTLARLKELRTHSISPILARHRGRLVRTLGDGLLIDFNSAVDAVNFAVAIQVALLDHNRSTPPDKQIVLRIGINVGDVVVEDDNILGDGVNVAARLETSCEPGGVLISRAVRDQIRDKLKLPFVDLGEREMKNISRPVHVFGLSAAEISALAGEADQAGPERMITASAATAPSAAPFSIVVMPFTNLSSDREQENAFVDGLTDSLATDLASSIEGLFVIASSTAFTYKGKAVDVRQVGRDLNVRYVLKGSAQKYQEVVRINAQLADAQTGTNLWAERFDADCGNLLLLQDRVAARIAIALGAQLLTVSAQDAAQRDEAPAANDLIIRARAAVLRIPMLLSQHQEAEALLRRALALYPNHPRAQAELGLILTLQVLTWGHQLHLSMRMRTARLKEAEELIDSALAVKFESPAAHNAKGLLLMDQSKWREAALAFGIALQLNPIQAGVWGNLARALINLGEPERAVVLLEEALRRSPRDPNLADLQNILGFAHLVIGNYIHAVEWLLKSRSIRPTFAMVHVNLALAYINLNDETSARASFMEAKRLNPRLLLSGVLSTRSLAAPVSKLRALVPCSTLDSSPSTEPTQREHRERPFALKLHEIVYRKGRPDDGAALLSVHKRAVELVAAKTYGSEIASSWVHGLVPEGYGRSMADGETIEVAALDDVPVAFCGFKDNEICGLFVDPDYMGHGIASRLLTNALTVLDVEGRFPVRVVSGLNAVMFYQSHGFTPVEEGVNITRGGLAIRVVELELQFLDLALKRQDGTMRVDGPR